jgi:hypothetical protein
MIERLQGLPDGVIGFRGNGRIEASDYRDVLIPAVDAVLAAGNEVRIVLVFEQWDGLTGGAVWQDLKMGVEHLTKWKKIALVTDVDWMRHATNLFGWMTPGDVKVFQVSELADATAWAAAD